MHHIQRSTSIFPAGARRGSIPFGSLWTVCLVVLPLCGCHNGQTPGAPTNDDQPLDIPSANARPVGNVFPYTRFIGQGGEIVDLTATTDRKKSLLVFMRGFSGFVCPYCTAQTAELVERLDEIHETGTELHVVFPGPAETIPKFLEAVRVYMENDAGTVSALPVLMDVDLKAVDALGIRQDLAKPCTFVLDADGKLIYEYVGADPTDRPSLDDILRILEVGPNELETREK